MSSIGPIGSGVAVTPNTDLPLYATVALLPSPPPAPALLVRVLDTGLGVPGLAVSTATGWNVLPIP